MADRVFEDRVGLIVIQPGNVPRRLPAIKQLQGGICRDVFLPRIASPADFTAVRAAGLYAHLWTAADGLTARDFANRTLLDIQRLKPGGVELNIELAADPPLRPYIREAVQLIRRVKPRLRMRVNVAPWKAQFLPVDLLQTDSALYACEQVYFGNMQARASEGDILEDLLAWGVPRGKATLCYAGAGTPPTGGARVCWLPDLARIHRGVIFQDDLLAEVGLLP